MPPGRVHELGQQRDVQDRDLRVQQVRDQSHREESTRSVRWQRLRRERRLAARAYGFPGEPQQVRRASELDRGVDRGHDREDGGDAGGRRQQVHEESGRDPGERDEAGPTALGYRAGDQVDHVRPGRQDETEGHGRDSDGGTGTDHGSTLAREPGGD